MKHLRSAISVLLASSCLTLPVLAQTAEPSSEGRTTQAGVPLNAHTNILEEVIVTSARRREENVQTTPVAVTALSADLLERAHVNNLIDMAALAPNLYIAPQKTATDAATIYLRGFGVYSTDPATDPHVALFLDGIYQPAVSGSLLDTFDLQQIEVQAGPQGTLAGKNAPVGTINVTSQKPTGDFSGEVEGDYGSYDHFGGRVKVNFPILKDASGDSVLAGRVSFVEKEGGNWVYNRLTNKTDEGGENTKAGRLSLAFTPSSDFEWDLTAALVMNRNPQQGIRDLGKQPAIPGSNSSATQGNTLICNSIIVCAPSVYGEIDSPYTKHSQSDTVEVASTMSYKLTPVTLTSVTGYISYWGLLNTDDGGLPLSSLLAYNDRTRYDQETEELRVSSNQGGGWDLGGRIDWVLGGYLSNFQYSNNNHLGILTPLGVAGTNQYEDGTATGEAVFLHVIYHFTDQWSGTFGVRQSWDHKDHDYKPNGFTQYYYDKPIGFHNTSFEAGTQYQFDENHMAYLRFAQGYSSGGYLGFPSTPGTGVPYQAETNNSYEIGFKSDWLDKRLRFNLDFFLNEVSNLQVGGTVPIAVSPGFVQTTTNAGSATIKGFESQIIAVPTDDITAHLTLGYLYPKYDKYQGTACSNVTGMTADCSGLPFGFAPRWTMDLGGDYVMDLPNSWGTATFSVDWSYRSTQYTDTPPVPTSRQEGYGLVNAGLKFLDDSEKYAIEFYGTNILDRHYKSNYGNLGGLFAGQLDGRPAEWGMRLTGKF